MKKKGLTLLLGLILGISLVLCMGAYDKTVYVGSTITYDDDTSVVWGTGSDATMTWDNTNGELDITTTGEVRITCSAVSDGQYGLDCSGAIAGATTSEGAAAYFHSSITGDIDGPCYNLGSWMDITGGTPSTTGPMAAIDCGIYESGADLSSTIVVGLQIQTILDTTNSPLKHYMMRFNTNQSGDTPDGWFWAANAEAIAFTAGANTGATKTGDIKIHISGTTGDGSGNHYIRTYDGTS